MTDRENPPVSTGGGDDGTTTLLGAGRIPKSDVRIVVLGDVDEASSFLGLARTESMGDVAMPAEENAVWRKDLEYLDSMLEEWHGRTEIPKEFVVPGETKLGAFLDVARSVVRRAERSLVAAGYAEEHPDASKAINRLSDLLFVVARNADGKTSLSKE